MNSLVPFGGGDLLLKEQVDHIELFEVEALKRACDIAFERSKQTENYQWIRDRDKLLIQMLWSTGARVTDVLEMSTTNIKFQEKSIKFLVHKRKSKKVKTGGEFWHTIPIDMETLGEIMDFIQTYSIKGFLFVSPKTSEEPMTRQAVNKKLNEYTELISMRKVHPHLFRHGLAMYLIGQGMPVEHIAHHLAHSSTSITLRTYARIGLKEEQKMIESLGIRFR
jgi:site-specific recombinase XerD